MRKKIPLFNSKLLHQKFIRIYSQINSPNSTEQENRLILEVNVAGPKLLV